MTEPTLAEWLLEAIADDAIAAERGPWSELDPWRLGNHCERGCITIDARRVLAECEAKRRILALHADGRAELRYPGDDLDDEIAGMPAWCVRCKVDHQGERWPCETLRLLAAPYAHRPGFREEWAV